MEADIPYYVVFLRVEEWGDLNMLTVCPKCKSKLETKENGIQICKICGYWTKKGTVRLDPLVIFGE
ncbi:MAG: hypothetical protein ACLFMM_08510 [Methanohalobium sp.]|uniref:hypothetical protein n=1 Tax=Methanohalobium sp. TaxID=2837493 RepID=UPI00397876BF